MIQIAPPAFEGDAFAAVILASAASAGCVPSTILVSDDPNLATNSFKPYVGFRSVSEHGRYVAYLHVSFTLLTRKAI